MTFGHMHRLTHAERDLIKDKRASYEPTTFAPQASVRTSILRRIIQQSPTSSDDICLHGCELIADAELRYLTYAGQILLECCHITSGKSLRFGHSRIGALKISGGTYAGIDLDGIETQGNIYLKQATVNGAVTIRAAVVGGGVDCDGISIHANSGRARSPELEVAALNCEGLRTGTYLRLTGATATGQVRLAGLRTGSNLDAAGLVIRGPRDRPALVLDRARIQGFAVLKQSPGGSEASPRRCCFHGPISFIGAQVTAGLVCTDVDFSEPSADAPTGTKPRLSYQETTLTAGMDATSLTVSGAMVLKDVSFSNQSKLRLNYAQVRTLEDERASWPTSGNLEIVGFKYDYIEDGETMSQIAKRRLEWIELSSPGRQTPVLYEQLSRTLETMGEEDAVRVVRIAQNRRFSNMVRRLVYGWPVLYGYSLKRPVILLALLWISASGGASLLHTHHQLVRSADANRASFQAVVYSLDALLPVVDLHQDGAFIPTSPFVWLAYSVVVIFAWLLVTVAAVGVTQAIRR